VQEATSTEGRKMIRVQVDVPVDPHMCEVDERWIAIAVYEIASNAIRHAREQVTVSLEKDEEALQISFVDDNRNATEFEPLRFRAPREARGLGLALAIVRDVVAAHGGSLRIERADNAGGRGDSRTRVSMRLPHVRARKGEAAEAHA
jgi:signal transduction histidine kinase